MTFTKVQMEQLAPYETHFETAVFADWSRYPGKKALKTLADIYVSATGKVVNLDESCGTCVLRLLKSCGKLYFADKSAINSVSAQNSEETSNYTKKERKPRKSKKSK